MSSCYWKRSPVSIMSKYVSEELEDIPLGLSAELDIGLHSLECLSATFNTDAQQDIIWSIFAS